MSENAVVQHPKARLSITATMAERYGMESQAFEATLRNTVVPNNCSREQFAAFLLVAREYDLNPLTKEIYAFPSKGGGIQPIVGVDGWANLINSHPAFDGLSFHDHINDKGELVAVTCRMHRKDRQHPIEATEYMVECRRNTDPWKQWPRRMLRHKAMIQAARYAFGFAGIVDPDEAERFTAEAAKDVTPRQSLKEKLDYIAAAPGIAGEPQDEPTDTTESATGAAEPAAADGAGASQNGSIASEAPAADQSGDVTDVVDGSPRGQLLARLREKALRGGRALKLALGGLKPEEAALLSDDDRAKLEDAAKHVDAKGNRE